MKLQSESENRYIYRIPHTSRISYILFAVVIILGMMSVPVEEIFSFTSIIPFLLFLVALFGLGYRDTWVFDGEAARVQQITGVYFMVRRVNHPFETVSHIDISHFTRGFRSEKPQRGDRGRNRVMTVLAISLQDGRRLVIEIVPERKERGSIESNAALISQATGLRVEKDRPYDNIDPVHLSDIQ